MSSLISRYYESIAPRVDLSSKRKGSPARNRIARLLKAKRSLQKSGHGENVRSAVMAHVGKKTAIKRKATIKRVAAERADAFKRLSKTGHQVTINSLRTRKKVKPIAKTKSFSATASPTKKIRGKKASLLENHVHYA